MSYPARMQPAILLGSIECLPSGRYRYRVTVGGRTDRSTYDTEAEAIAVQLEDRNELA